MNVASTISEQYVQDNTQGEGTTFQSISTYVLFTFILRCIFLIRTHFHSYRVPLLHIRTHNYKYKNINIDRTVFSSLENKNEKRRVQIRTWERTSNIYSIHRELQRYSKPNRQVGEAKIKERKKERRTDAQTYLRTQ